MRKIFWLGLTFVFCCVLKIEHIWLGFTPVMLSILAFRFEKTVLWEIPLAVLCCSVLELAFKDDLKLLLQVLILCSTVVFSVMLPRKILLFFLIITLALVFENIYSVAAVWAALWCAARTILAYFTTKTVDLQEYKS